LASTSGGALKTAIEATWQEVKRRETCSMSVVTLYAMSGRGRVRSHSFPGAAAFSGILAIIALSFEHLKMAHLFCAFVRAKLVLAVAGVTANTLSLVNSRVQAHAPH
jgi:hypothetical protein